MANQSPDRRQVLAMLAKVASLSQVPGFSKWVFATEAAQKPARSMSYHPQFFTPAEYRTLDMLCELIIPADETPGAHEAGVSEFIDFLVSRDDELQYPFRTGLGWLNALSQEKHGGEFADISGANQEALLTRIAVRTQHPGSEFFFLVRKHTVIGFYTSRIGLESLDDPGLRFYSTSPECPHKDDPEHKHLRVSR